MTKPDWATFTANFKQTFKSLFTPFPLFLWGACWIFAVLAGPFGTFAIMTMSMRVFFWGAICTGGIIIGFAVQAMVLSFLGSENHRGFAPLAVALSTVLAIPMVIGTRYLVSAYVDGLQMNPVLVIINIIVVTSTIFLFRQLLRPKYVSHSYVIAQNAVHAAPPRPIPRLNRRLSDDLQGEIIRISANNHHVEVVTEHGLTELRMRLVDAIEEMEPVEGMCVHRSHWVARQAIVRVERVNAHKITVHLSNGDEIPASRKYRVNLEDAGLVPSSDID